MIVFSFDVFTYTSAIEVGQDIFDFCLLNTYVYVL